MGFFNAFLNHLGFSKNLPPQALPKSSADFEAEPLPKQDQSHACADYTRLKGLYRDIGRMNAIIEVLGRDFLTAMPEGAYKSRLGQIAFLYRRLHEDLTDDGVHRLLENAQEHQYKSPDDWDEWDNANLREMRELYLMYCHVDPKLMEKKARLSYEGRRRHRAILKSGDWEQARTFLQEQIDLHRRIADSRCEATGTDSRYEMLMQEFMPHMKVFDVENLFDDHEQTLKTLMPEILAKQKNDAPVIPFDKDTEFEAEAQMWLNRSLLEVLGFDFERGGLYETGHNPVEGGTVDDTRLVIYNVDESNFLDSMKSALHEGGHGLYIQGLPRKTWRYQPVAMDMGAAVHESQALLIEMIIGRKQEFFEFISPRLEGLFHGIHSPALSPENLFRMKTRVTPGIDRKKADEVSYFYHVLLRFRLERDLIDGNLDINKLPEAWVEGMHEHFGVTPSSHIEGCLQDVHWFVGKFGYFPSYAIGHMMAAQIYETLRKEIGAIDEKIADGEFEEITAWLARNIYSKGRLLSMPDMLVEATGKPLRADYLEKHLRRRYLH
ncbi:MAG: hypothetical protein ACLFR0_05445 [Alphaproteobacteria bacterium]